MHFAVRRRAGPASIEIVEPAERDRLTGARLPSPSAPVRPPWMLAWWSAIAMWFTILVTGRCPAGLAQFTVGAFRGVCAQVHLLLVDEYPPFTLEEV
jgi:hypothetical protein